MLGTFGQEKRWQLGVPSTYQHPLSPSDTLQLEPTSGVEKQLKISDRKVNTPSTTATPVASTTTAEVKGHSFEVKGHIDDDGRQEVAGELFIESVVSVSKSLEPPELRAAVERDRGVEKQGTGAINIAELENNSEVCI